MIEYLEELVENGDYKKALAYADQLLLKPENKPIDLVAIHVAVLRSRYYLNEYHGALVSGQLAMRLAEDLEGWDYYGTASFYVGVVWARLGQPDHLKVACYNYLSRFNRYNSAQRHQTMVWYNLGIALIQLGEGRQAIDSLKRGLGVATRLGISRHIHGMRHGLIQAYMLCGDLAHVPRLLAQSLHFLRNNPDTPEWERSLLFHFELRSEFALQTKRPKRALTVARKALKRAEGQPENQFHLHMMCAKVHATLGNASQAVGHALSARIYAIQIRRYELESLAAEFMYEITKFNALAVDQLTPIFPHTGEFRSAFVGFLGP